MVALEPLAPPSPSSDFAPWFTWEVLPHEPHPRLYLRTRFPAISDPDDVIQEGYLRLFQTRQRGTPLRSPLAFLLSFTRVVLLGCHDRRERTMWFKGRPGLWPAEGLGAPTLTAQTVCVSVFYAFKNHFPRT